jgi:hypothetical protein
MKHHVLEEHHEDGTKCYVFLPPNKCRDVDGTNAKVEDEEETREILTLFNGNKWLLLGVDEEAPPPRDGEMAMKQGKAPLARQVPIKDKPDEHICSLCGKIVKSWVCSKKGVVKGRYHFRTHISKCHTLPVVIEYSRHKLRELACPVPARSAPDYISLGKTSDR